MEMNKDTEEKIRQLQLFEQNMHNIITQKQRFQSQLLEIENALSELQDAQGKVYKIVGTIMIDATKHTLEKDLNERKDVLELRLKSVKKQEDDYKERAEKIQKEVMRELEQKETKNE